MAEVASAYVSLMFSAKGAGSQIEKAVGGDATKAGTSVGKKATDGAKKSFLPGMKSLIGATAGLAVGAGIVNFFKDANAEARESQKVGAITANVIKTTGGAANVSAKQVGNLATAISNKSGIDDEAIQSASNLLLTFTNLRNETGKGNDVFNQATQAATDMGAALGKEPKAAAIQLGKALNDPTKGITALSRAGVSFTEKQKSQIKSMQKSGNVLGAQKIILGEVKKEFGGTAEASATAGDKFKTSFANLKEQVGTAILPAVDAVQGALTGKVIPAISGFISQMQSGNGAGGAFASAISSVKAAFEQVAPKIAAVFGFLSSNIGTIGAFVGVILAVVAAMRIWAAIQLVLNAVLSANPIGLVVIAIAALVAGFVYAYQHSETFRTIVQKGFEVIRTVVGSVIGFVKDRLSTLVSALKAVVSGGIDFVLSAFDKFKSDGKRAFEIVGQAGKWLWNNALQPAFKLIVGGVAFLMRTWASMLRALSKVPGFGWAKSAADAMDKAAGKAQHLADNIGKLHDKKVTITYNEVTIKSTQNHNDARTADGARAAGGPVAKGKTYLVGENGPELFSPVRSGTIIPRAKTGQGTAVTGGGAGQVVNFNGNIIGVDPDAALRKVDRNMDTALALATS